MKKIVFTLAFSLLSFLGFSQETYNVNNESLTLKTEVDGTLDFLWTSGDDGRFRYFIKNENGEITELQNTKTGKNYNNEYQTSLNTLTSQSATDTKFTLYSIKRFISDYNKTQDANFVADEPTKLAGKLAIFGGISNNPFIQNPDNKSLPFAAVEFEVSDAKNQSRHAGFANLRHTFENDDIAYSATQLALGYRYKFINKEKIKVFAQTKFATITYSQTDVLDFNTTTNTFSVRKDSGTTFDVPFIFGLGADFKVGEKGSITLIYDSLFSALFKENFNFPMDFAVGYKFSL